MSADMMIICKEDDSHLEGKNSNDAFFIDETSMGEPWTAFGKWFGQRYCRAPSILEQIVGDSTHKYLELTRADYEAIKAASEDMEMHHGVAMDKLLPFIETHIGKHISTENW